MTELINVITENGIGIVCVGYLIYFQNHTMTQMIEALNTIKSDLKDLKDDVEELKQK
jgi:hypothetical protein